MQDGEALEKVEAEFNAKTPRCENAETEDPSDPSDVSDEKVIMIKRTRGEMKMGTFNAQHSTFNTQGKQKA